MKQYFKRLAFALSLLGCLQLMLPVQIWAQSLPVAPKAPLPTVTHQAGGYNTGTQQNAVTSVRGNFNLDLSSTHSVVPAGQLHNFIPTNIIVNGQRMSVAPTTWLTPAEVVAVEQVLHANQQLLSIGTGGNAIGGTIVLSSAHVQNLESIVVPKNVSLDAIGFNSKIPLNVTGSVDISGSVFTLQTAPNTTSVLNLGSLNVGPGGLLSANLPASLPPMPNLYSSSGMTLDVVGSVTNRGTINSPGTLNITAGGNIVNQTANGNSAVMSAPTMNLITGSGNIANSGVIQAVNTLNVNTVNCTTDLLVNNAGGVLQASGTSNSGNGGLATNGTINFRSDGPDVEQGNVTVLGGSLSAGGGVNVFGKGMEIRVDSIVGPISTKGSVAHVSVTSGNLTLGTQLLTGDPTYYNNAGDITISSLTSVGGDLAVVASGNVITTGATTIQTTATNNSIFIGAGLNFDIGSGTNTSSFSPNSPGDTGNTLTFSGTTNPGMNINAAGNALNVTTTGTGTLTMVATGSINIGGGTISTGSGDVLFMSGTGFTGAGGTISTGAGNVTIASANPAGLTGTTVNNGTMSSLPTAGAATAGNISVPSIASASGSINLSTGSAASVSINGSQVQTTNATISITADQLMLGTGSIHAGSAGTVTIVPFTSTTPMNFAGGGNGLQLSNADLGRITAGTVILGSARTTGGIAINGSVDVSNNGYALQFLQGAGGTFTNNSTLNVGANNLTINVGGAVSTGVIKTQGITLNITGSSVNISGDIGSAGDTTSVTSMSGAITGLFPSTITAGSLVLTAAGGDITGNSNGGLWIAAPTITTTQTGAQSITITDSVPITGNGVSTAGSGGFSLTDTGSGGITTTNSITTGGPLQLVTTSLSTNSITIGAGGVSGGDVTIDGSINGGAITIFGPVTGTSVTIKQGNGIVSGSGLITATSTVTVNGLNSDASITLPNLATPGLEFALGTDINVTDSVAATITSISGTGHALTVTDPSGITVATSCSAAGTFTLNSDNITIARGYGIQASAIIFNGMTTGGSLSNGTNMVVTHLGNLFTLSGNISIASAPGQDLQLIGIDSTNGSPAKFETDGTNESINITATDSATNHPTLVFGPGNQSFISGFTSTPGGAVNITAPTVIFDSGVSFDVPHDFTNVTVATGSFLGSPSQFVLHTVGTPAQMNSSPSYYHPNPNSTLTINTSTFASATIANSSGPVDLSQVSTLDFSNTSESLAILSATNIINSGNGLTINLSGGAGTGGNLMLIAGFNFSPSTSGTTIGPGSATYNTTYTLSSATAGGSILLSNVNIDTSGATGGGTVIAVAPPGSVNSGSVSLGTITTTSSAGPAGSVAVYGNGVAVGAINAAATNPFFAHTGSVALYSVNSVSLTPNASSQILNGVSIGTVIPNIYAGSPAGTLSVNAINVGAGAGGVILQGNDIISNGLITAGTLTATATGPLSALSLIGCSNVSVSAGGSVNINNIGNVSQFIASAGTTLTVNNTGNITVPNFLSNNVVAPNGVSITLNGVGNTLTFSGNKILSTNAPVSIVADNVVMGTINAGTGTVSIAPFTSSLAINLAGGTGGLHFSNTDLGKITAGTVVLGSTQSSGGISINGPVSVSFGLQFVQGSGGAFTNNSAVNVGSNNLVINVGGVVTMGSIAAANNLNVTGASVLIGNSFTVPGTVMVNADNVTIGDGVTIQGNSVSVNGQTQNGSFGGGTNMTLSNSGIVKSAVGGITIASAAGQDLTITGNGNGQFIAPSGQMINIIAIDNPSVRDPSIILGPGNQSIVAGTGVSQSFVNITAEGSATSSVTIQSGVTYDFPSDYSIVNVSIGSFFGNPSQFTVHTAGQPNSNSILSMNSAFGPGTIANSSGPVDLSQVSNLNFPGANIAILSATDITNSGNPLTISLDGGTGTGGNLVLVAGFNFTPSTGGVTVGPNSWTYTFTGAPAGGSIKLGNVNIDTSGATGGGSVLAVANQDTISDGSISLGTITTTGGTGTGGSVTVIGNGISVGAINTTANTPSNSGSVSLTSATSVGLSNPAGTQVTNGVVTGGAFQPGSFGGAISLASVCGINAGTGSVNIQGGNISGSGLISANNIMLYATEGSIGLLNTADGNILNASAGTNINIINSGSLNSFVATAGTNVAFTNTGHVTLGGDVSGPSGVAIVLNGTNNTLNTNGNQINATNATIAVTADQLVVANGSINAGVTGNISIMPFTKTTTINLAGGGSGLQLSNADLGNLNAGAVVFGSAQTTGGINLNGAIDVSGKGYALQFLQGAGAAFANNSSLNVGSNNLTINVGGAVTTGVIQSRGITMNITGGSVNVTGSVGSSGDTTSINSTAGSISGVGTVTSNALTLTGAGGNVSGLSAVDSGSLSVTASAGSISLTNLGNLTGFSANGATTITFTNTGNVRLNGGVSGLGGVIITLNGASNTLNNNGNQISSTNSSIVITTDQLAMGTGSISAGTTGTVTIRPFTNTSPINLAGGSGGLQLSNADLAKITAGSLVLGSAQNSGGIAINGVIDVSNNGYALQFLQGAGGTFTNNNSLNVGSNNLTIRVGGAVSTGAIETQGIILTISGSSVEISGSVGSAGDTTLISSTAGGVNGVGLITANNMALNATSGNIGPINTVDGNVLNASASGSINITNTGSINSFAATSGTNVAFTNTGDVALGGSVIGPSGVTITLNGTNNALNVKGSSITSTNAGIALTADRLVLGTGTISAGSGNVAITPFTSSCIINLAGGTGGLQLSNAQLGQIAGHTLIIGSLQVSGGLNINGAIDVSHNGYALQLVQGAGGAFVNNNTLNVGANNLTINAGGAVTTGVIQTQGITLSITGESVNINANVGAPGDSTSIMSTAGSIIGAGTVTSNSLSFIATVGSLMGLSTADVGRLSAGAGTGSISLTNVGDLSSFAGSSAANFTFTNTGNVTLNGSVVGPTGVTITLNGVGNTLTANGNVISATNSLISITTDHLVLGSGSINAGATGNVTIAPFTSSTAINLAGGTSGLQLSASEMTRIIAGTLVIGSTQNTGGIVINGSVDMSNNVDALTFLQGAGGAFTNTSTLNVGTNSLTINVGGSVNTGVVQTQGSVMNITGSSVNINGSVGSSGDNTSITSTAGSIIGSGILTANSIVLTAMGGNVGGGLSTVDAGVLCVSAATGSIGITNAGNLTGFSANGGTTITFTNTGNVTLNGSVTGPGGVSMTLNGTNNLLSTNGNQIKATDSALVIATDQLAVGTGSINAGATGTITIVPSTSITPINLAGGSGGLQLSNADLAKLNAMTVVIGSPQTTGGINVNGPIDVSAKNYGLQFWQGNSGTFTSNCPLNVGSNSLTINTGAVTIVPAGGVSAGPVTIAGNGGPVSINGPVTGTTVEIDQANGGNIVGAGLVTGTASVNFGVTTNQSGQMQSGQIGFINLSNLATPQLSQSEYLHANSIQITDSIAVNVSNVSYVNTFILTDRAGITWSAGNCGGIDTLTLNSDNITLAAALQIPTLILSGQTPDGVLDSGTGMVVTNLTFLATISSMTMQAGNITIASATGQDLQIIGNTTGALNGGVINIPAGLSLNIIATDGADRHPTLTLGPGNQTIKIGGGTMNITAPSVSISPGVIYDVPDDSSSIIVNTGSLLGSPSQFVLHTVPSPGRYYASEFHPNPNSTFTINGTTFSSMTIVNSSGAVDLSQVSTLNYSNTNQSLAILAAGNIINTGNALTINLSASAGTAGSLLLMAGFDFAPSTGGKAVGPGGVTVNTTYTVTGVSGGGSINLGNVNIDTSGVTGGGTVSVFAAPGTINSGFVRLGAINTSSSQGPAGSVNIYGNGISVGAINANSPIQTLSGSPGYIRLVSATGMSSSQVQVSNGMLLSTSLDPMNQYMAYPTQFGQNIGTISLASTSGFSVTAIAGSIIASGVITSDHINLQAAVGSVNPVSTVDNGFLFITSAGSINVTNTGSPTFVGEAGSSLYLSDANGVDFNGTTSCSYCTIITSHLTTDSSSQILATAGNLVIQATTISSSGANFSAPNGAIVINSSNGIALNNDTLSAKYGIYLNANAGAFTDNGGNTYNGGVGAITVYGSGTGINGMSGVTISSGSTMMAAAISLDAFDGTSLLVNGATITANAVNGYVSASSGNTATIANSTVQATGTGGELIVSSPFGINVNSGTGTSKFVSNGAMFFSAVGGAFTDNGGNSYNAGGGAITVYGSSAGNSSISIASIMSGGDITLDAIGTNGGITITTGSLTSTYGLAITSTGAITLGSGTLKSTQGALVVSAANGISLTTAQLAGTSGVYLYGGHGAFSDGGGSYTSLNGPIDIYGSGSTGITLAAGSTLTSNGIGLVAYGLNGIISIGGTGSSTTLNAGNGGLFTSSVLSITIANSSLTAAVISTTAGTSTSISTSQLVASTYSLSAISYNGFTVGSSILKGATGEVLYAGAGSFVDNGGSTFNGGIGTIAVYGSGTASSAISIAGGSTATAANVSLNALGGKSLTIAGASLTANGAGGYLYAGSSNAANITNSTLQATGIGGQLIVSAADGISINAGTSTSSVISNGAMVFNANTGAFADNGGNNYNAGAGVITVYGAGVTIGAGTSLDAKAINLLAYGTNGSLTIGGAGPTTSLTANSGMLYTSSSLSTTVTNSALSAGVLSPAAPGSGTLATADISSIGNIYELAGGSISVTQGSSLTANGGSVQLFALGGGGITSGANDRFTANGGGLQFFTPGPIAQQPGVTGNNFTARAMGTATAFVGGMIEMGAGTLQSLFAGSRDSVTNSVLGGSNVNINYPVPSNAGIVEAHIYNSGSVNLNTSGSAAGATNLNMTGGAVIFDSVGAANTVNLDGATFTVSAFRPIAYTYGVSSATELMVDGEDRAASSRKLADIFVPGTEGVQVLTATDDDTNADDSETQALQGISMNLRSGQLFIRPRENLTIRAAGAEVCARKYAMLTVCLDSTGLRVAACSGPGDVTVMVQNRKIVLAPGEELVISSHALTPAECLKSDGIGRRVVRPFVLGQSCYAATCEFSIASMLANTSHLQRLVRPSTRIEKKIASNLMKTAATIDTVMKYKGVYQAHPPIARPDLLPVGYAH